MSTGLAERAASRSVRPAWPSLKMITADAPAASAFCGLDREVAGAALDQRDVAGGEAGEVRGLAAASRVLGSGPAG